jgi:hypothetical protein
MPTATIKNPHHEKRSQLDAYHGWLNETGFDEIKTHQRGAGRVLRSKSREMVEHEIWALLLTYHAIRPLMKAAADEADADPDRLSFIRSLRVVRRQVTSQAVFPLSVLCMPSLR